jgi:hypothetical protein
MGERDQNEERSAARVFSSLSPIEERDRIEESSAARVVSSSLSPASGERAG